jgi:hypothetical protein
MVASYQYLPQWGLLTRLHLTVYVQKYKIELTINGIKHKFKKAFLVVCIPATHSQSIQQIL